MTSDGGRRTAIWKLRRADTELQFRLDLDEREPGEKTILEFFDCGDLYEADLSNLMLRVLEAGDTVFDIGANCGYFTILAATLVGASGQVFAFEPAAERLARLRSNLSANRLGNAVVVDKAVTDRAGDVIFHLNRDSSGGHALWDPGKWPTNDKSRANPVSVTVGATTVDTECRQRGLAAPKLIKIDTEGAEQRVLEGARTLLSGRKVPFVVAELHEFGLAEMGCTQESLRGLMDDLGYSTFGLYLNGALPKLIPPGTRIQSPFIINLLFSTPEQVALYWPAATIDPRSA